MENCIFCKIVEKNSQGENVIRKVYEDDNFLGFLDIKPINPGHCLLIPKKHYRWVDDVPNFGEYFEAAKKIGLAIKKSLSPTAVCYVTLGFEVPHAHIRIIPRYENDGHEEGLDFKLYKQISEERMVEIAELIKSAN